MFGGFFGACVVVYCWVWVSSWMANRFIAVPIHNPIAMYMWIVARVAKMGVVSAVIVQRRDSVFWFWGVILVRYRFSIGRFRGCRFGR